MPAIAGPDDDNGSWLPSRLLPALGTADMLPDWNVVLEVGCDDWKLPEAARPDCLKLAVVAELVMPAEGMKVPEAVRLVGLKLVLIPGLDLPPGKGLV